MTRWIDLSGTESSYEGFFDLIAAEQFLESCPRQLQVYLKERGCKATADLAEHAAQYLAAHEKTLETLPKPYLDSRVPSVSALAAVSGAAVSGTGDRSVLTTACLFCNYQHATNKCRKVNS